MLYYLLICFFLYLVTSLPPNIGSMLPTRTSNVAASTSPDSGTFSGLPSYDQCIPDGVGVAGGEDSGVVDENELIARQEARDEHLARQMIEEEEKEVCGCRMGCDYGNGCS